VKNVWECGDVDGACAFTPRHAHTLPKAALLKRSLLLALVLMLASCAPPADPLTPFEATPPTWSTSEELLGTEWVLVELNGAPPMDGSHITLEFAGDGVGGYAGCNWYAHRYEGRPVDPDTPGVTFTLTARACAEQAFMDQEQVFWEALHSVAERRLSSADRLEFYDAAGVAVLAFARQPQLDLNPADLVGTRWRLTSLGGAAPLEGSEITLAFDSATELSGHAGCRDYRATYQAEGDDLNLTFMEMLQLDCADEARLLQEGEFMTLLGEATDYRRSQGELEIVTASGRNLLFAPSE